MFSPYYARARRHAPHGLADPMNHCAINVALYRCGGKDRNSRNGSGSDPAGARWAMTERGRSRVTRSARTLQIGPSGMRWDGNHLHIEIDEVAVPWPSRLRGTVRLHAPMRFDRSHELAPQHHWHPIAPTARVQVDLGGHRWAGDGYLDSNHGDAPLERAFTRWDWSRARLAGDRSAVFYDVERRDGESLRLGLRFDPDGRVETIAGPPVASLPRTGWGVARSARADAGTPIEGVETLTDAPFYARSLLRTQWLGEPVIAVHESLSMTRFDTPWVQAMLPFRMPRWAA